MRTAPIRIAAGLVSLLLLIAGCGGGGSAQPTVKGCALVNPPKPRRGDLAAPQQTVHRGEKLTAVVTTTCGRFDIALDTRRAPKTTNSFVYLARKGFYDGLSFFRIMPSFVIQGGDPLNNGIGNAGYEVDEPPPPNLAYTKGIVAMAKSAAEPPGRSGSQFFVVIVADAGLPPVYAILGQVSDGLDVVERIGQAGSKSEAGTPKQTVLIDSVTIEKG